MAQPALKQWGQSVPSPTKIHKKNRKTRLVPQKSPYFRSDLGFVVGVLVVTLITAIFVIQSTVTLTSTQHELQAIAQQQTKIQSKNTSSQQEISELSSRTRLSKIAAAAGLTLDESSTRNVTK
ncbi:cell division protein FtsL [Ligilactobacillus sp. WILCCON 0076]|uniref:Cell division protein FtsL n=1 Tax=Ligilactobacillus ubinensis TaxID=2876789 RepID=A0A9X2JLW3_9LACO|nr:cell division protein FtsL [Ligilactobacillus ubinensis]MCP0886501.1 cell division protein FtsL [Ligilactobacillus ubinensis]